MKLTLLCCCVLAILNSVKTDLDPTQSFLMTYLQSIGSISDLIGNTWFTDYIYTTFQLQHPDEYLRSVGFAERKAAFAERLTEILSSLASGALTFDLSLNQFSDWTSEELAKLRGIVMPTPQQDDENLSSESAQQVMAPPMTVAANSDGSTSVPAQFDYTVPGVGKNPKIPVVGPIKNQQTCGSCYAFAMVSLLEAQYSLQTGNAANMSEQQIVDCSKKDNGCNGGFIYGSFDYVKSNQWKMNTGPSYPYKNSRKTCGYKPTDVLTLNPLTYRRVEVRNATAMKESLVKYGPLYVSAYVGSDCTQTPSNCPVEPAAAKKIQNSFSGYSGGVFQIDGCTPSSDSGNNHAMVIVGYGTDSKTNIDYWKVRNSWSTRWGEKGYLRIRRGVNMCNIESTAFYITQAA